MRKKQETAWPALPSFRFSSVEADAKLRAEVHINVEQGSWGRGPRPGVLICFVFLVFIYLFFVLAALGLCDFL